MTKAVEETDTLDNGEPFSIEWATPFLWLFIRIGRLQDISTNYLHPDGCSVNITRLMELELTFNAS